MEHFGYNVMLITNLASVDTWNRNLPNFDKACQENNKEDGETTEQMESGK